MASNAVSAFQTQLQLGDGAAPTENFSTVAELRTISGPSLELETIDVTTHNTSQPWRSFIGGLLNAGEVNFDINFIPTNPSHSYSSGILSDMVNRVQRNMKLVFPDAGATEWQFTCLVTGFEVTAEPADVLIASVTLKLTGVPTLAG